MMVDKSPYNRVDLALAEIAPLLERGYQNQKHRESSCWDFRHVMSHMSSLRRHVGLQRLKS